MKEIIIASIFFLISIGTFVISILSFRRKGFLFNNAYIYASKMERDSMDKKPYYHQSAITFLLISFVLLLIGIGILLEVTWVIFVGMSLAVMALIYAIVSDIAIERRKKQ